ALSTDTCSAATPPSASSGPAAGRCRPAVQRRCRQRCCCRRCRLHLLLHLFRLLLHLADPSLLWGGDLPPSQPTSQPPGTPQLTLSQPIQLTAQ
nr:oct2 protein isoform - mouse [Mus musculus]